MIPLILENFTLLFSVAETQCILRTKRNKVKGLGTLCKISWFDIDDFSLLYFLTTSENLN